MSPEVPPASAALTADFIAQQAASFEADAKLRLAQLRKMPSFVLLLYIVKHEMLIIALLVVEFGTYICRLRGTVFTIVYCFEGLYSMLLL